MISSSHLIEQTEALQSMFSTEQSTGVEAEWRRTISSSSLSSFSASLAAGAASAAAAGASSAGAAAAANASGLARYSLICTIGWRQ
jgi:hypothetical protein